ncbi:MAG: SLBB domain-containing protein [Gammaproteobacteria bacterium]
MRRFPGIRVLLFMLAVLALGGRGAAAQQRDSTTRRGQQLPDTAAIRRMLVQRFGRNMTNEALVERLRGSGLTRAQVRARLQPLGYDPGLVDRYFDAIERGGEVAQGNAPSHFIEALTRIGVVVPFASLDSLSDTLLIDSLFADSLAADTLASSRVFGMELFGRTRTEFEPTMSGPVDPGYRLGPGDEIQLVLTGDVEEAYALQVNREGFIFIPDVGQISVNGLMLGQLEDVLYSRLGRVYSGVSRSAEATTRFQVSLGRLRINQVFVIGDVLRPGAYQVSAAATVLHALYRAGGPKETGSFRNIEVVRTDGERQRIDLYEYLLYGDSRNDVRLDHGDRVFVPTVGAQVDVQGAVKRPLIYEVRAAEGVRDVLAFAGGLQADALIKRVQIDRILPPDQREPGLTRVLQDVDLTALSATDDDVPLQDGDMVVVFAVSAVLRNRLYITGEVREPGLFEYSANRTLWTLIERADGLSERAYTPRALIYRLNEQDGSRRLIQSPVTAGAEGAQRVDVTLMDGDSVVILSREELANPGTIYIEGYVKQPGEYTHADGMTLKDLILEAGGFVHGAYVLEAEVSRLPNELSRTDTTALVFRVPLKSNGSMPGGEVEPARTNGSEIPVWFPDSADIVLAHGDRVFIRKAPGYDNAREVSVTGQVMLPGRYVLRTRQERISELIARAGGLTPEAYAPGMHVVRDSRVVAADLNRALTNPRDANNIQLEAGDSVHVPAYDPMVLVGGAVNFETHVLYRLGAGLDYYVRQAGGYTDRADKGRTTVTYQNGERAAVGRFLFVGRSPRVQPGSTVFVPAKPETQGGGFNWDAFITRTITILSTTATLLIAVRQLN